MIEEDFLENRCDITLLRGSIQCWPYHENEDSTEYDEDHCNFDYVRCGLRALLAIEGSCPAVTWETVSTENAFETLSAISLRQIGWRLYSTIEMCKVTFRYLQASLWIYTFYEIVGQVWFSPKAWLRSDKATSKTHCYICWTFHAFARLIHHRQRKWGVGWAIQASIMN